MRWSLKLGKLAGIKIFMHWTFFLLIAWIFLISWGREANWGSAFYGVAFILALFACVVLHELGHALTARRYGIQTRDITLLPIGGVARLERMPRDPGQELWVAIAGPAVNVAIAALLFAGIWLSGINPFADVEAAWGNFAIQLMWTNLVLVVFNMLPAFPMDGGRVLRALLAERLEYTRATLIAARVGQVMAVIFGALALFINPLLLFIAIFVFLGAEGEAQMVQMSSSLRGITVQDAMLTRFRSLSAEDPLNHAVNELLAGSQQEFPVVQGEEVVGMLAPNDLVKALSERGPEAKVADAMRAECKSVNENDQLEQCYDLLRQNGCATLPVIRQGRLIGLITLDNLTEWMMIHSVLQQPVRPAEAKA